MKANWKHLQRAKRWTAGDPGMSAAATALRARHMEIGAVLAKPAQNGTSMPSRVVDAGERKKARRSKPTEKQGTVAVLAIQETDADRARRMELLMGSFGIWKGRQDIPHDGLEYQRNMRAEWD